MRTPARAQARQNETAINARGFEVDFLRRQPVDGDPHLFRFSGDEDDLWPVQAERAAVLTSAPRFEHAVISVTGRMATMRTVAPQVFVDFKRWMAEAAPQRDAASAAATACRPTSCRPAGPAAAGDLKPDVVLPGTPRADPPLSLMPFSTGHLALTLAGLQTPAHPHSAPCCSPSPHSRPPAPLPSRP